jgi:hypothetical protein
MSRKRNLLGEWRAVAGLAAASVVVGALQFGDTALDIAEQGAQHPYFNKYTEINDRGEVVADFDPLEEEVKALKKRYKGIEQVLGENYQGRCLTAGQVKAISDLKSMPGGLNDNHKLLVKLHDMKRTSAIGRYVTHSAAQSNVVNCIQDQRHAPYLGLYANWVNVTTINVGPVAKDATEVLGDKKKLNLALRTALEESTHAWQHNHDDSLAPPEPANPLHTMLYHLGVEAQAKVATFMALQEMRERGNEGPWNDAISGRTTDKAQMMALQKVLDKNPDMKVLEIARQKPEELMPVFEAFYTDSLPRELYERHVASWAARSTSKADMPQDLFNEMRGTLPGLRVNFLENTAFSIDDPKIVAFFDMGAKRMIETAMERAGKPVKIPHRSELEKSAAAAKMRAGAPGLTQ